MGKILLPDNHYFITASTEITELCKNLFTTDINYFCYARIYDNKTTYLLPSDPEAIKFFYAKETVIMPPIPLEIVSNKFNVFLPSIHDEGPYQPIMHMAVNRFNIGFGINLFERGLDYFDIFCFCSSPDSLLGNNYYLNHMDVLQKFILKFQDEAAHLIKNAPKNTMPLSLPMQPNFIRDNKFMMIAKNLNNKKLPQLSKQEYACLKYLAQGRSAKEIGLLLMISPRTVESYLSNIKIKLGYHRKSDLINFYYQHHFNN